MKPVPPRVMLAFATMAGWILGIVFQVLQWRTAWDSVQVAFMLLGAGIGVGILVWLYLATAPPIDKT